MLEESKAELCEPICGTSAVMGKTTIVATSYDGVICLIRSYAGLGARFASVLCWAVLVSLAACSGTSSPGVQLDAPTGRYAVGALALHLVDDRPEANTADPTDVRELMVHLYYPAGASASAASPYFFDPREALAVTRWQGLGDHDLDRVEAHAIVDADLAASAEPFRVVFFSHGYGVPVVMYRQLIEELVSRGYVVVAIAHSYYSGPVVFPDGRTAAPASNAAVDDSVLATWTDDARFVLETIDRIGAGEIDGRFAGRLDLAHLGVFGHSYGGALAATLCAIEPRFAGGIDMDGVLHGDVVTAGLDDPFLVLTTRDHVGDPSFDAFTRAARAEVFVASIADTAHMDFSDWPALFPIYQRRQPTLTRADLGLGDLPVERIDSLVRAYVVAFFEHTFSGTSSPLLEAGTPAGAPEVRVDVY